MITGIVLACIVAVVLLVLLFIQGQRFHRLYESVISSLDLALAGKEQEVSPYLNSRYSAIASRLTELERKINYEVENEILENSIKYSPADSKIEIQIEHGSLFTEIAVSDEGMGMDKEEYPFIFKRFYRGKEVGDIEGSGIGLYLVKMIVEKEKGYVVVKSEKGRGTTVSVFLQNMI